MTIGVLTSTQTTDLTVGPGARESSIAAPVDGALVEISTLEATMAQDLISISAVEAHVVTLEMRQVTIQLVPV